MFGFSSKKKPRLDAITAFLGAGTQYHGQFNFQGVVRIDGGVIGNIIADGTLVLGEQGYVEGRIQVAELVSSGHIVGDVEAASRATLFNRSSLCGNLLAPAVIIEEGATINGFVRMAAPENAALDESEAPPQALTSGDDAP